MNKRLDHQLDAVCRTVRQLRAIQVRVHRVIIDAQSARPVIETGTGPFDWVCEDFGHDSGGPYWNYSARFNGIELRRTVRDRGPVMARDKRFHHDWTPEMDAALIEAYRTRRKSALKVLSIDWGIPQSTLQNRAVHKLGAIPFRTHSRVLWTDAEETFLVRYGHERPADIQRRLREAGFRRGLKAGLLAATVMTPNNPQAKNYRVKPQALRLFCLAHTQRLMQLHPDIVWYTDLICGGKRPAPPSTLLPPVDDREYPLHLETAHAA